MGAEDLLDKFAQDEGFGNWDTVVLNCHHSVIRSVAIAAVKQALHQLPVIGSLRFSDEDFITNLCLSYRHDYGLLGANERNLIRFECKEWLRAIINNWDNTRTHVFPNVP